ncbi:hypothetical protein ACOMHN_008645 [Nucella lapillus]
MDGTTSRFNDQPFSLPPSSHNTTLHCTSCSAEHSSLNSFHLSEPSQGSISHGLAKAARLHCLPATDRRNMVTDTAGSN